MNQLCKNSINDQLSALQDVGYHLIDVAEEQQEAFDAMPESLQVGERGKATQEAINQLKEAMNCINNARDALSEALSQGRN
jgi:hypothetical protein